MVQGASRNAVPVTVWIATALLGFLGFVAIAGSFLFAFPMGPPLGYVIGPVLILFGLGYGVLAWRLRFGERRTWIAAIALPILHTATLNTLDLVLYGAIPPEDYPFMAVAALLVLFLVLPPSRRFASR